MITIPVRIYHLFIRPVGCLDIRSSILEHLVRCSLTRNPVDPGPTGLRNERGPVDARQRRKTDVWEAWAGGPDTLLTAAPVAQPLLA
jgi:hypothetical protein